jgi:CheY-like chemotaxis protein
MTVARKILIVEDHPAIRNMLISLFKNAGYQVTECSDGALGLSAAQGGGYEAIILDLKMPQMDGFEFMKNLKLNPPIIKNGPIIVFSSVAYDYAQKEALDAGAADFILKDDLEAIHLVDHVESVIQKYNNPA